MKILENGHKKRLKVSVSRKTEISSFVYEQKISHSGKQYDNDGFTPIGKHNNVALLKKVVKY